MHRRIAQVVSLIALGLCSLALPARAVADRYAHTATLLVDGRTMVVGGASAVGASPAALAANEIEIVNEQSGGVVSSFNGAGLLPNAFVARASHTATLLPNGRILVAGGIDGAAFLTSVQIINPNVAPPTVTDGAPLPVGRHSHTATLLKDGRTLLCGGQTSNVPAFAGDCYIYNVDGTLQNTITMVSNGSGGRGFHTATLLRDGRVFLAGGVRGPAATALATTEIFSCGAALSCDSGSLIPGKVLNAARSLHQATMMADGRVMLTGGFNGNDDFLSGHRAGVIETVEIYDPTADAVQTAAPMAARKMQHTATLRTDGSVIVHGGLGNMTTSYFQAGAIVGGQFVSGTLGGCFTNAECLNNPFGIAPAVPALPVITISTLTTSNLQVSLDTTLSADVSGVIQDGEILFSNPEAAIPGGRVRFIEGTEGPSSNFGLKANLAGQRVTCENGTCGKLQTTITLSTFSGTFEFDPADMGLSQSGAENSCVRYAGSISDADAPRAISSAGGACLPATFGASSFVCGRFDIPFDPKYEGATLSSASATLLNGVWSYTRSAGISFTATLSGGVGDFTIPPGPNLPVALTTVNGVPTAQSVSICFRDLVGTIAVNTDVPQSGAAQGSGTALAVTARMRYVLNRVDMSDQAFTIDVATVIVRRMLFQDFECYKPKTNAWSLEDCVTPRPSQSNGRERLGQSATLLPNGDLRYFGGRSCGSYYSASYPACTGQIAAPLDSLGVLSTLKGSWAGTAQMSIERGNFTATILPSGKILLAGGTNGQDVLTQTDIYDPSADTITPAGDMNVARDLHTATLLINGRVLAAGGFTTTGGAGTTATAELFYPDTRVWIRTASLNQARDNHTATVLPDGTVLVIGGYVAGQYLNSVERYSPITNVWTLLGGTLATARAIHTATLLPNGTILVTGGVNAGGILSSAEIVDPATGAGTATTALPVALHAHNASLLQNGDVLVGGGNNGFGERSETYRFRPSAASWTQVGSFSSARMNHTMTLLPNGHVLAAGGAQNNGNTIVGVETFHEASNEWTTISSFTLARAYHSLVVAPNGQMVAFGGYDGSSYLRGGEKLGFAPTVDGETLTQPSVRRSSITAFTPATFDRGQTINVYGSAFKGLTEASGGGGGSGNSDHYHPRLLLQAVDHSGGGSTQGSGGFIIDLTTYVYLNGAFSWLGASATLTATLPAAGAPAALPYGWYQMRVVNNGVYSEGKLVQAGPALPTGTLGPISSVIVSSTIINWTWTLGSVAGHAGFNVYSATTGILVAQLPNAAQTSFVQGGLQPNATSQIIIAPYSMTGDGALAYSSTFYTFASSPTALSVSSVSVTSLELRWDTNRNAQGTIYEVSASADGFATSFSTPVPALMGVTTNHVLIQSLSPNTAYSFRVQAYNFQNFPSSLTSPPTASGFSNVVSTTTRQTVSGLAGSRNGTTEVQWSWNDMGINTGAGDRYRVYNSTSGQLLASVTAPTHEDVGLATNTARSIMVSVFLAGVGEGPLTPGVTVFTDAAVPAQASPSVINLSTGGFSVVWTANGNPLGTLYQCVITPKAPLDAGAGTAASSFTTTDFFCAVGAQTPPAGVFDISVRAINGDSFATDAVDATKLLVVGSTSTLAAAPTALTLVSAGPSSVSMQWARGNNASSATYEVSFSTDGFVLDTRYALPFSQRSTVGSLTVTGLVTAMTYEFRVRAQNIDNQRTAYSNLLTVTTPNGGAPIGAVGSTVAANGQATISGTLGDGRFVTLSIPNNTFPVETYVSISSQQAAPGPCGAVNVGVQITLSPPIQPLKPVFLTLSYTAADLGAVPVAQATLHRYDPQVNRCIPLRTTFDTAQQTFTAQLNHFSMFQLARVTPQAAPDFALIFPNPFYPSRGHGYVTLSQLPANTKVEIFTLRGESVWEGTTNGSGLVTWPGVNTAGRPAASGVYLAVAEHGGRKHIYKLAVVR